MRTLLFSFLGLSLILFACDKPEGEGGSSTIKGRVYKYIVASGNGDTLNSLWAADKEVFISYGGGDITPDDRVWTGPDGHYEFNNLTTGTYNIYVYSYCDGCAGGEESIQTTVEIAEDKSTVNVDSLVFKQVQ